MTSSLIDPKNLAAQKRKSACPIYAVNPQTLKQQSKRLSKQGQAWLTTTGFSGNAGEIALVPDEQGKCASVFLGLGSKEEQTLRTDFLCGSLPGQLPEGIYHLAEGFARPKSAAIAWALGSYKFDAYKKMPQLKARLIIPENLEGADIERIIEGTYLTRDLINTPANDLGPAELEAAVRKLARTHKARMKSIKGKTLEQNFPLIHTVGRASSRPPSLIDMVWGQASHPKVTLVGKGVCFDTGGLNLKPGSSMGLMKKDMGGAANVLGLASMIMDAKLPVRLRVLIPAVDNNVSGNAFRPGDVLKSRLGLSVEIGNTDAEGRLVLADALALADEEKPEILIDMATLTGAARVALGPELPPFYCDDDNLAGEIMDHGQAEIDPLWRMPFWKPYEDWLGSKIADVNHISEGGFAGSITAALFLKKFVKQAEHYIHFDIFAWTPKPLPGRPYGGEAQAIRALYALLKQRFSA